MDKWQSIINAMNKGLVISRGCTEPIAIAYAGAVARSHTGGSVKKIQLLCSSNIIKNAFVVNIPGTDMTGLEAAVSLGVACANPEKQLDLLSDLSEEKIRLAQRWISEGKVIAGKTDAEAKLYIEATVHTETDTVKAIIIGTHTNIARIEKNGELIYNGNCNKPLIEDSIEPDFTLSDIYEFCTTAPLEQMEPIKMAIELNSAIAREGMHHDYGLRVGKTIDANIEKSYMTDDITNYAMKMTAAGSDARMAGATFSVMTNSGSGNQGITATVPVYSVWEKIGVEKEQCVRACAISNLTTIYIKAKFEVLSAFCGAVISGAGSACGIVYLLGGGYAQMEAAIHNMLGNVTGMLCDGAKASCALKISTCINAAMQAALLAMQNLRIGAREGIVEKLTEDTIENVVMLGNKGTYLIDQMMLDMIINKKQ